MKSVRDALETVLRTALTAFAMMSCTGTAAAQSITLTHVHGLAYGADGTQLFVPSHDGLAIYSAGRWSKAPGPQHDYMGFTAAKSGLYSSGHPAAGSGLKNPFGLIKSADGGRTWQKHGLEGEADFHLLAASYETNAVYVYNAERNSRMDRTGLYYTLNDGFTWTRTKAHGLTSQVHAIAVHPSKPQIVGVAANDGLFLSTDSGESFERLAAGQTLGAFFELDGEHLIYSMYGGMARLYRHSLNSRRHTDIPLPPLTRDAVSYIAQNTADRHEYAIATFERSVFITRNLGKNWLQIAQNGRTK